MSDLPDNISEPNSFMNEQEQGLHVSQLGSGIPLSQQVGTSKSTFSAQRLQTYKAKLAKRQRTTESLSPINLSDNISQIKLEQSQQLAPFIPSVSDDQTSISSRLAFNRQKLSHLKEQQNFEHSKLVTELQTSAFNDIIAQVRTWERQQDKFRQKAEKQRQQEINEETSSLIDLVCSELLATQSNMHEYHKKIVDEIKHISESTSSLFEWHFNHTNQNFTDQVSKQNNAAKKLDDIEQALELNNQTIDLLFNEFSDAPSQTDIDLLYKKVMSAQKEVLDYISSELSVVSEHLQIKEKQFSQIPYQIEQYVAAILPKYMAQYQVDLQQNSQFNDLQQKINILLKQNNEVQQKLDFSYFATNLLIQQDQYIKQGLQDSAERQTQLLDIIHTTNQFLQQHVSDPAVSQQLDHMFKDSVMSLNLNKKYDLPQIDKISNFFNLNEVNEREQMDCFANDNKTSYQKNVDEFFKHYPTKTFLFNIETQFQGNEQPTNNQQEQAPISTTIEVPQQSSQPTNEAMNNPLFRLPKPQYGDIKNILRAPHTREEPTFTAKQNPFSSKDNYSIPKEYQIPQPSLPKARPQNFDLTSLLENKPGVNTGGQLYGQKSSNPNLDIAKLYANFNFKEKFTRQMHPQMFILQFETVAEQCHLTSSQMAYQFMFCLQNEYFDWYKVQAQNSQYHLEWETLKSSFIETFSHDDEDVRDDLNQMYQDYGETPYAYLQRLRTKTVLSNLTDTDVKIQFVNGLKSQDAKNYLNYMKQFAKNTFKRHTSTTLLQQLEKQARIQRFSLVVQRLNTWKPQKSTFTKEKQGNKSFPSKNNLKKVNFVEEQNSPPSSQEQLPIEQNQMDNNQPNQLELKQVIKDEVTNIINNPDLQSQLATTYANYQDYADQPSAQTNTIIDTTYNIVDQSDNKSTTSIKPEENAHVQAIFRKQQKNSNAYTDKLVEFAKKGKELQKLDVGQTKKYQYQHLTEQQLITESPLQFLQYSKYFQDCLEDKNNLLKCQPVLRAFNKFTEQLQVRFSELQTDDIDEQEQPQTFQMVDNVNNMDYISYVECMAPINYLLYVDIKIFNTPIQALLDTGSTVTVISRSVINKHKLIVPDDSSSRPVTLANGSMVQMKEWKDVIIKLDQYNALKGTILISENATYDMLFGLNAIRSINASISGSKLKYSFMDQNKKQRFGSINISTKQAR